MDLSSFSVPLEELFLFPIYFICVSCGRVAAVSPLHLSWTVFKLQHNHLDKFVKTLNAVCFVSSEHWFFFPCRYVFLTFLFLFKIKFFVCYFRFYVLFPFDLLKSVLLNKRIQIGWGFKFPFYGRLVWR